MLQCGHDLVNRGGFVAGIAGISSVKCGAPVESISVRILDAISAHLLGVIILISLNSFGPNRTRRFSKPASDDVLPMERLELAGGLVKAEDLLRPGRPSAPPRASPR